MRLYAVHVRNKTLYFHLFHYDHNSASNQGVIMINILFNFYSYSFCIAYLIVDAFGIEIITLFHTFTFTMRTSIRFDRE